MIFDKEKNTDIQRLRKLRNLRDKELYKKEQKKILKKYGISIRTLQYWLNKKSPGKRKGRNDAGKIRVKISRKEKSVVKELLESGKPIKDLKKSVSKKMGRNVSHQKISRIRKKTDKEISDTQDNDVLKKSNFGNPIKELISQIFGLDKIPSGYGIPINISNNRSDAVPKERKINFILPREDAEDIILIVANSYNRNEFSKDHKLQCDREMLREKMILHLMEQQVQLAGEHHNTKDLEAITRMHDRMRIDFEMKADIKIVEKICKHLKPDISFEEIVGLLREYTEE